MSKTLAFLGATGDCAGYALANALQSGLQCRALARTPEKLLGSMSKKGVTSEILKEKLTIVKGNAKNVDDVKQLLSFDDRTVDGILFGIGGTPVLRFSLYPFDLDDPTICATAAATLLSALRELRPATKPSLIVISSTGITNGPRDVPIFFVPFYHWLLARPHVDKRNLEQLLRDEVSKLGQDASFSSYVAVRPSFLLDGETRTLQHVRVGTEHKPSVGYFIDRKSVGAFIFERLLKNGAPDEWRNEAITLTY